MLPSGCSRWRERRNQGWSSGQSPTPGAREGAGSGWGPEGPDWQV